MKLSELQFPLIVVVGVTNVVYVAAAPRNESDPGNEKYPEHVGRMQLELKIKHQDRYIDASGRLYETSSVTSDGPRGPWYSFNRIVGVDRYGVIEVEARGSLSLDEIKSLLVEHLAKDEEDTESEELKAAIPGVTSFDELCQAIETLAPEW